MVGFVILNFNTPEDVLKCVESIREKTVIEHKIYVVDNGSKDNSVEIFEKEFSSSKDVTIMTSNTNGGFSAGNNIGIARAIEDGCKYVCLINADIVLVNDATTILVEKMENDATIGVAAPSIEEPSSNGEAQFARIKLTLGNYLAEKTFLGKFKSFRKKHPRYLVENQEFSEDYKFFGMTYGCMYVARADFLQKTGMLDDAVFLFNEEDIVAHKLEDEGLYTLIVPSAKVFHNHHSSISKTSVASRIYHLRLSPLIVLRKYDRRSAFTMFLLATRNSFAWFIKSIVNSDFRKFLGKTIKKSYGTMRIKKVNK